MKTSELHLERIVELHLQVGKVATAYRYEEITVELVPIIKVIDVVTDKIKIERDRISQLRVYPTE